MMSLLGDHGAYWENDEQVLIRIAAEIDADFHQDSPYWRGDGVIESGKRYVEPLRRAIRARRERVAVLALARIFCVGLGIAVAGFEFADLWSHGVGPLESVVAVIGRESGPAFFKDTIGLVAVMLLVLASPLDDVVALLVAVPAYLLAAALVAFATMVVYAIVLLLWRRADENARFRAIARLARAGESPVGRPVESR
jgi:hypothetical protein